MAMTSVAAAKTIAGLSGITETELFQRALESFLHEKKRDVLQHRLDILGRYGAESPDDLQS